MYLYFFPQILDDCRLPDFIQFIDLLLHNLHKLSHVLCKLEVYEGKLGNVMCI